MNSYGTGYSNADEILFYHIYMSKKKIRQASWPELCDRDSLQSGTQCSGSRVEIKMELTELSCSPVLLGAKSFGKVSYANTEPRYNNL